MPGGPPTHELARRRGPRAAELATNAEPGVVAIAGHASRGREEAQRGADARVDELARANMALQAEIRDHRRAEGELRTAKERLAMALEGSRLALWDCDARSGELYLSEQWAAMLGEPPHEMRTTLAALFELTHPDEREGLLTNYIAAAKGLLPEYKAEHRLRAASGHWIWVLSHGLQARA